MKVLTLANCAHRAYHQYLTGAHPDWDVRAVIPLKAKEWIDMGHEGFIGFLRDVDLFVGFVNINTVADHVNPQAKHIGVPSFSFGGFTPDIVGIADFAGILENNNAHSRLAAAGHLSGLTINQTAALFNKDHFASVGYFDRFNKDRNALCNKAERFGLDVSDLIDHWLKQDRFLYYPVHPNTKFFFDMLDLAMRQAGYPPDIDDTALAALREGMDDYLS